MPEVPASAAPATGATPAAGVKTSSPSLWTKIVNAVAEPWAVIDAKVKTKDQKASESKNKTLPLGASFHPAPIATRSGALGATDYSNRPTIQILSASANQTVSDAPVFSDFILTSVTGGDAEKAEVVETFGIPHLFTSGRFMRRYTFAGSARAVPANAHAAQGSRGDNTQAIAMRISQHAALERFYDDYLRITKQAETGRFTRVTVDGEVYDGWVLSFTPSRTSDSEGFASFTFTMVVRNRSHPKMDADLSRYLQKFAAPPKAKPQLSRVQLTAQAAAADGSTAIQDVQLQEVSVSEAKAYPAGAITLTGPGAVTAYIDDKSKAEVITVLLDGATSATSAPGQKPIEVSLRVSDTTKLESGPLSITFAAPAGRVTKAVQVTNASATASPGKVSGAVASTGGPLTFTTLTAIPELPYDTVLGSGKLTINLQFSNAVSTASPPFVSATSNFGSPLSVAFIQADEKTARIEITVPQDSLTRLNPPTGAAESMTVTVNASGGTFSLPSFSCTVIPAAAASKVTKPIAAISASLLGADTTTAELVLSYTFDAGVADPLTVLATGATITLTRAYGNTAVPGSAGRATTTVYAQQAGSQGAKFPWSDTMLITVRVLKPEVTAPNTVTQRLFLFLPETIFGGLGDFYVKVDVPNRDSPATVSTTKS